MKLLNFTILFSCLIFLFSACNPNAESSTTTSEIEQAGTQKVLKIGVVPQFSPKRIITIWSPIIEELEQKTGYKFQIIGTPSIPEFEKEYQKGTYDIAYMNPYHSVVANQMQGYEAVLRDGTKSLFGVLVVKKEDNIRDIKELDGEKLSFPAPNALGASLLMRTELKTVHNIEIEPVYVKTHTNSYLSVLEGKTRAGGGVMRTFNELGDDIKNQLRIFYETQKTPPHPIVIHPRVDDQTREAVVNALLEMGSDEELNAYLEKIPIKKITKTTQEAYRMLEDLGMEKFYVNPD